MYRIQNIYSGAKLLTFLKTHCKDFSQEMQLFFCLKLYGDAVSFNDDLSFIGLCLT